MTHPTQITRARHRSFRCEDAKPVAKQTGIKVFFFARFLLGAAAACLSTLGPPEALSRTQTPVSVRGTLSFAERVTYQYAIEEVLWRHRIWPEENPGPKPSLDEIMLEREIEGKVEDYLRKSRFLRDHWHWPITPADLQAEIERMASHTKQPAVLRELFAALGNQALVVAECLARPIVAERRINGAATSAEGIGLSWVRHVSIDSLDGAGGAKLGKESYKMPQIFVPLGGGNDAWTPTTNVNAPDARLFHSAVWTGSEMIIWGGFAFDSGTLGNGARYNPATDSWSATAILGAPVARTAHTAVWTGTSMIIWGGANSLAGDLNTGAHYDPATDNWVATSTANAPMARGKPNAIWTGTDMIIWGGRGCNNNCNLNSGGRYNPKTDSWASTSISNAPSPRFDHTAVWTGREMIVWGGTDAIPNTTYLRTGGRYDPRTDTWTPTSLVNAPLGRVDHTRVWTGSVMIVWGGVDEFFNDTSTGGKYDPTTDSWVATGVANGAPTPRDSHSAVWTGREMIIWGGTSPSSDFNDGKRYDPATDSWTPMTTVNAPFARADHTAVWTGNEMIVWGGISNDSGTLLNTGGRYCAQPSTPLVQSAVSRKTHGSAGNFDVDLPLSGTAGVEARSGGTTGDYTIVVRFLADVSVSGTPQAAVTSAIGQIGSAGMSNGGAVVTANNEVIIPLTNVANAQTIEVTLNNVNGSTNVTIPMSVLVGDVNGNGAVNASDVGLTKSSSGQPSNATNFRADVNANGSINATDVALVKALAGTGLP